MAQILEQPALNEGAKVSGPGLAVSLALHSVILVILAFVVTKKERQTEFATTISGFNDYDVGSKRRRKAIVPVQIDAVKIEPVAGISGNPDTVRDEKFDDSPEVVVQKPSEGNVSRALAARAPGDPAGP